MFRYNFDTLCLQLLLQLWKQVLNLLYFQSATNMSEIRLSMTNRFHIVYSVVLVPVAKYFILTLLISVPVFMDPKVVVIAVA